MRLGPTLFLDYYTKKTGEKKQTPLEWTFNVFWYQHDRLATKLKVDIVEKDITSTLKVILEPVESFILYLPHSCCGRRPITRQTKGCVQ